MTTKELRNRASELGIKNYTKYTKEELLILVEQAMNSEKESVVEEMVETTPEEVRFLPSIIYKTNLVLAAPKERKKRGISFDIPKEGSQAYMIYKYFEQHYKDKTCTIYKCCKVLNTPSHNTKRIFDKFFKEKRNAYLQEQVKEEQIVYIQEEDMN